MTDVISAIKNILKTKTSLKAEVLAKQLGVSRKGGGSDNIQMLTISLKMIITNGLSVLIQRNKPLEVQVCRSC